MSRCRKCKTETCAQSDTLEPHVPVEIINRDVGDGMERIGILWGWTRWQDHHPAHYEVLALDANGRPWRVDCDRCEIRVLTASDVMRNVDKLTALKAKSGCGWVMP